VGHRLRHGLFTLVLVAACGEPPNATPADGSSGGATANDDAGSARDDGGSPPGPDLAPAPTTIRIHYPAAGHTVTLRGDALPLDWNHGVALTAGSDGAYSYVFADLPSGAAEFKPLLDDVTWSRGPNYRVTRGATVDVYPHFFVTHGQVVKLDPSFHSTLLDNDRVVWAYLPPSYDENPLARYPVLYMHDGQNLFDPALAFGGNEWKVDETLDAAYEGDGHSVAPIAELIVVAPENAGAKRMYEYTPVADPNEPDGGGGELYLRMLVEELKPSVGALLRTLPARATTGVMGSSLGGLISAYAGVAKPDVFGIVGAMSPSTWWDNDWIVAQVAAVHGAPLEPDRVYVDCGTPGDDYPNTQMLVAAYLGLGYVEGVSFLHVYQPGAQHNEIYWAARLPTALAFLFPPR
jgi:predicted alpha/beta superfamily hydrolase